MDVQDLHPNRLLGAEFAFAAIAGVCAGFFTNPIEVVKNRLQLQGELAARGSYEKIYRNSVHAAVVIVKHEGFKALQSGVACAMGYQFVLSGLRLGSYHFCKSHGYILNDYGEIDVFKTTMVTGATGIVGTVVGSPFFMVKTQLQSQAAKSIAVGYQHQYRGTVDAFRQIWRTKGFTGLYQGWYANLPKVFFSSGTQLCVFGLLTDWMKSVEMLEHKPILKTFLASLASGAALSVVITPFDVLATRLYNQGTDAKGRGVYYSGIFDALHKIFKTEGLLGLYKGIFPCLMKNVPQVVLCQVFYENIANTYDKMNFA